MQVFGSLQMRHLSFSSHFTQFPLSGALLLGQLGTQLFSLSKFLSLQLRQSFGPLQVLHCIGQGAHKVAFLE